jgi:hypothetical protein
MEAAKAQNWAVEPQEKKSTYFPLRLIGLLSEINPEI